MFDGPILGVNRFCNLRLGNHLENLDDSNELPKVRDPFSPEPAPYSMHGDIVRTAQDVAELARGHVPDHQLVMEPLGKPVIGVVCLLRSTEGYVFISHVEEL